MKRCLLFLFAGAVLVGQTVPDQPLTAGQAAVQSGGNPDQTVAHRVWQDSGQYIVELSGDPAALHALKQGPGARRWQAIQEGRTQVREQQRQIRPGIERVAEVLASVDTVANAFVVRVPAPRLAMLKALPGVKAVHPVHLYKLALDHALPLQKVPEAWAQIGGIGSAGAGIKIGLIDTGIDANHPGFADGTLAVPDGFPKVNKDSDAAWTNHKVIVARVYTSGDSGRDRIGHGTAVAMIAAGVTNTGPYGAITGVAPKAWLGSYKVFPDLGSGAPDSLILKALDDAVKDGMDVINMSLGSLLARNPADDVLAQAVERASAAGVLVVIAAGNDGPDAATISSPGTAPSAITVGNALNDRTFAGAAQLSDGSQFAAMPAAGLVPVTAVSGTVVDVASLDGTGLSCSDLPAGSLAGSVALILRGGCTFEVKLDYAQAAGAAAAIVYTDAVRPDAVTMAVGGATLPAVMVGYDDGVAIKGKVSAGGVTAGLRFTTGPVQVSASRLASTSSRGPSVDYAIKPEILAVGNPVYSAAPNGSYQALSGTSLAAPMVSGAAALLKAARPGLTAQQYRSLLVNTASIFPDGAIGPVQYTGSGLLSMTAVLGSTVAAYPATLGFGSGLPVIDAAKTITVANLGTAPDTFSVGTVATTGSAAPSVDAGQVFLQPGESREITVRFSAPSLQAGTYQGYIAIQGTQSAVPARVPYWYAVPTGVPRFLVVLDSDASGAAGSDRLIYFRVADDTGVSIDVSPQVTVVNGGGSVVRVAPIYELIPGAFGAQVKLGPSAGSNIFRIQAGELTKDVTISGTGPPLPLP